MLLTNTADIGLGEASIYALLGYAVVFFGLILLMTVVVLLGKYFVAVSRKQAANAKIPAPAQAPAPVAAPGTAGQLKLHNVDPKTAAILMAITADKTGRPINELRFLSIREVTQ